MRKKENKRNQILLSALVAFIMVSSILGYMAGRNEPNTIQYNKFRFYQKNFLWATKINNKEVVFNNLPTAVSYINISDEVLSRIKSTLEVDTTYDQNSTYKEEIASTQFSIEKVLHNFFNIYVRKGFTEDNDYGLPVITCSDATQVVPVIYFKKGNSTSVYLENNCIIAEARDGADFLKLKDRLIYGLFGVI